VAGHLDFPVIAEVHADLRLNTNPRHRRFSAMADLWTFIALGAIIVIVIALRQDSKYRYPPSPPGYNIFKGGHSYLLPRGLEVLPCCLLT